MEKVVNLQKRRIEKQYKEYYSNPVNLKHDTKHFNSELKKQKAKRRRLQQMRDMTEQVNQSS